MKQAIKYLSTSIVISILFPAILLSNNISSSNYFTDEEREQIIDVLREEMQNGEGVSRIRAAEYLLALDYISAAEQLHPEMSEYPADIDPAMEEAFQKAKTLAVEGNVEDIPLLLTFLDSPEPEVRVEAANALLRIERRIHPKLHWLAWLIIVLYFLLMIGIGYAYMKRNKSVEDYLLGGRSMRSFTVGLSLFATLLSTITYLSTPGEIIKHGPLFLSYVLAMPVVYFVIGWLFIPFIMRLKVTSAYEILERRFDLSVRSLSSSIFLLLRILWMAVIIYATTDKIIIPIVGLSPEMTPWIGALIGVITLLYTSMGGIKAVVLTDAIQSFILFGGAVLVMILITINLGGVGEWWPDQWMSHWAPPRWGFQTSGDRTFGWFFLSPVIWWVCTTGSDQMAIQRFLSTRDVKTARRVLFTSLLTGCIVIVFLSVLGFALLTYFMQNPHLMLDGQTIYENADQLLPQFIGKSLPVWAGGLVIAGLMAAAMSSLSSGVNSSSAVIAEDFIYRFRKNRINENKNLNLVRLVSVIVGVIVVILSLYASVVPGNLLEVTYRVSNLLTVPLFIMFFMAMFIPWATVFGTWIGTLASASTAIIISFWENIFGVPGPSFLFMMPAALLAGIVFGMIVSWLPIGPGPKPMISRYNAGV